MADALTTLAENGIITEAQRRAGEALAGPVTPALFQGLPSPALIAALVESVALDGIIPPRLRGLHGPWPAGAELLRAGLDRLACP
ncbi:MAG: hypothetical protein RLY86_3279 [Pseudomonadota bacterium]|jgi:hypothetical protein